MNDFIRRMWGRYWGLLFLVFAVIGFFGMLTAAEDRGGRRVSVVPPSTLPRYEYATTFSVVGYGKRGVGILYCGPPIPPTGDGWELKATTLGEQSRDEQNEGAIIWSWQREIRE